MQSFELSFAIPQLPTGDVEKTAAFFERFLGFEAVAKLNQGTFLIVRRGPAEIHFWKAESEQAARDIGRESSCYIRVKNIPALFAELRERGAKFRYELKVMPWGMNEFQIDDPYANAIKFGEPLS
jgi:uncharacterized glyoxalase superfamily protein PhnB